MVLTVSALERLGGLVGTGSCRRGSVDESGQLAGGRDPDRSSGSVFDVATGVLRFAAQVVDVLLGEFVGDRGGHLCSWVLR
jgi:hypothetical protein